MPVLLHKLNNATQYVTGLSTLLSLFPADEGGEGGLELPGGDPSAGLADAAQRVDDLGWALAVVATAEGADLVLERREPRGVDVFLWLLAEALNKSGVQMRPRATGWRVAHDALDGWQVPWGAATFVHGAAQGGRETGAPELRPRDLAWECGPGPGGGLWIAAPAPSVEVLDEVRALLPGARVEVGGARAELELPPQWARPAAPVDSGVAEPGSTSLS